MGSAVGRCAWVMSRTKSKVLAKTSRDWGEIPSANLNHYK